jgi:hypothetical protein
VIDGKDDGVEIRPKKQEDWSTIGRRSSRLLGKATSPLMTVRTETGVSSIDAAL